MTLASGGYAAPLSWPVMAHGLDHLFTGVQTVVTGRSRNSVTSQVLQEAGLSSDKANQPCHQRTKKRHLRIDRRRLK